MSAVAPRMDCLQIPELKGGMHRIPAVVQLALEILKRFGNCSSTHKATYCWDMSSWCAHYHKDESLCRPVSVFNRELQPVHKTNLGNVH